MITLKIKIEMSVFCKAFQQEGTPQVVQTWKKGVPADS